MKVIIDDKVYEMSDSQCEKVLNVAKNLIPKGIYAIKKGKMVEMKNESCMSDKELSDAIAGYVAKGFKVYFNGGA